MQEGLQQAIKNARARRLQGIQRVQWSVRVAMGCKGSMGCKRCKRYDCMQGLQQPEASPFYPLAAAAQLASVPLCVSSLTLGRDKDPSSWILGSPLLCPCSHQLSRGQLQAALTSPQDIFGVSKPLKETKPPPQ